MSKRRASQQQRNRIRKVRVNARAKPGLCTGCSLVQPRLYLNGYTGLEVCWNCKVRQEQG